MPRAPSWRPLGEWREARRRSPSGDDRVLVVARDSAIVERAFANLSGFARSKIDALDVLPLDGSLSGSSDPRLAAWRDALADVRKSADPISEHGLDARELAWGSTRATSSSRSSSIRRWKGRARSPSPAARTSPAARSDELMT